MKSLRAVICILVLAACAIAQQAPVTSASASTSTCIATVATLTSACGTTKSKLATVTDGSTTSDCTVGGGTNANACIYTGAAWAFAGSAAGAPAFNTVTTGTNTTALAIGTGGSLAPSGTGTISANQVNGAIVPLTKTIVGTNGSGQVVDATAAALSNNTSGTASNLSGTPALPNGTTATTQTAADNTTKLATDAFVIANAGVGTITGVTAGTGITGGGTSGAVTVNLATALPNGETATTQSVADNTTKVATDAFVLANAAGAPAFNSVTTGTNTTALAIGTGGSLAPSGTGTISANQVNGAIVPLTKPIVGTNGSGQFVASTADAVAATLGCADSSASGTTQTCTTSPTFTPAAGDCVNYTTTTANTGAGLTLNVNTTSAFSVAKWAGTTTTLAAGDVPANKQLRACLDAANHWEIDTIGNAPTGTGTVTSTSVVTANGVSGSVATPTSTPAITLTLGAITPTSITDVGMTGTNLCVTQTAGALTSSSSPCPAPAGRQLVALAAPLGAGSSSAATVNLTLPTWKSGGAYPGLTGNRQHSYWVQQNTADGTSWNYAFKNTTGNIASASVTPAASGLGGATTDGSGTWTNQGPASCSATSITIAAGNVTVTTPCTLNGSNPLHVANKVELMNLTNANDLCLNRVALTVGTVNTNTFVAPTACPSTGPNSEAGTAWVSTNFNAAVPDFFALDLLPYYFQQVQYEISWVGGGPGNCDTATGTTPAYAPSCYDAQFNNWYQDVNFPTGGQISMTISHVTSNAGVNVNTPQYVAAVTYAATIINPLRWASGTTYNWGNAVFDGTNYELFLGTAANSVYVSSGSTPSWNGTVGGTTTDGTCTSCWFNYGTTAPPQMFIHSTAGGYVGNGNTSAFTDGLYWMGPTTTFGSLTVTNIVSACGGCTVADLVSLFPLITNQPYMAAALAFDQTMAAHFTSSPWIGAVAYIRPGQTLNGQGYPYGAAVLKGSSFANLSTAQWNTFWISAIGKFEYGYAAISQNVPLKLGLIEFSPQASNNPADAVDAPAIADGTASLAEALSLPLSFNGLRAADLTNFSAGTTLYADWAKNVQNNNGSSPVGSVQQAGPGSCVGTTNRMDLNLQLPTILAVHAFEAYSADYWALDPNNADYSYVTTTGLTCSQLYISAIAGFVSISNPVTEPLSAMGAPFKMELANGQTADALDIYPYSSNGEGTANYTISPLGALTASAMSSAGLVNFSGASEFRPKFGTVASLPGTCTVGDVYEATNATAGQNWYFCTTTNTWTQQLNGGGMTWPGAAGIGLYSGSSSWSTSIALNSTTVPQTLTSVSSGASFGYAGIPVDATNPATLLNTDRANYLNWTSGTALALPAVSGAFASNMPLVLKNTTGSTLTITPNAGASDLIDGASAGNVLTNFAAFVYQDSTTAPGHWFTIKLPTAAAFGATCANVLTWATTTGFGCAALPLTAVATQAADSIDMNATGGTAAPTAVTMPTCATSGHADVYDPSTHAWTCNAISAGAPSLDTVTGSAAQATGTETAASHEYTFAGVETAALTSYISLTDANSSNNNSSGAVVIGTTGTSTGAVPLRINEATAAGDLLEAGTGGAVASGVLSGFTQQFAVGKTGSIFQSTDAIGSGGSSQTISAANGAWQSITLSSATLTISFTQPTTGTAIVRLKITQAAGANDAITWTSVKWPGGIAPVMTAAANAIDWYSCVLDGTSTWCTAGQNFQ